MNLRRRISQLTLMLIGLWLVFEFSTGIAAEILWFQEVGYLQVLLLKLKTQGLLGTIALLTSSAFLLGNLSLARRLQHPTENIKLPAFAQLIASGSSPNMGKNYRSPAATSQISFPWLLLAVFGLSSIAIITVIHCGLLATDSIDDFRIVGGLSAPPIQFGFKSIQLEIVRIFDNWWELGLVLGLMLAVTIKPDLSLRTIALVLSLAIGLIAASRWTKVLQYFHPTNFNITDPIFSQDISFYVFILPTLELLSFGLTVVSLYGLVSCALTYLLSGNSLSQGIFLGFSRSQQRHLYGLGAAFMVAVALRYGLARYGLLYSRGDVTYGANYADMTVRLPSKLHPSRTSAAVAIAKTPKICLHSSYFPTANRLKRRILKRTKIQLSTRSLAILRLGK